MLINKRQIKQWGKKLKTANNNHVFWIGLTMLNALLALVVALGTISAPVGSFIAENITWRSIEQAKVEKLAPTETVAFFNSVLGEPNIKSETRTGMTRYIYRERGYWVEAMTPKEDDTVLVMSITACGEDGFYPTINNNPAGKPVVLGRSKMIDTTYKPLRRDGSEREAFKVHYFLRAATAPSYYYDEYGGDALTNYQTVYTGFNDLCGYIALPKDIIDTMGIGSNSGKLTDEQINRMRGNITINTFAVTAPTFMTRMGLKADSPNIGDGGIGVDYVDAGVLLPSPEPMDESAAKQKYKNVKDFEVIKTKQ